MSRKSKNGTRFQSLKWMLLLCSAAIFLSFSNTDERKNFGLNGNVKSCFERLYEVEENSGKWENGRIKYQGQSKITFDEKGQYQEIEYYDDNMDLTGKRLPVRKREKKNKS